MTSEPRLFERGGWPGIFNRLVDAVSLDESDASDALREILDGNASDAQIAAFLVLLRSKGESVEELTGFVRAMCDVSVRVELSSGVAARVVDTCGTGGDRSSSINVSTIAAFVVAAANIPVCKHGNRAASSQSGSADVLEALGVRIDLPSEKVRDSVEETGLGFCFAPRFHPALRNIAPVRKALGIPTAFNFLGPLANPAGVKRQVVGVGDPAMADRMINVLRALGSTSAMVVFGHDGLDELTTTSNSTVHHLVDGEIKTFELDPTSLGLKRSVPQDLVGADAEHNAERALAILSGNRGPQFDIIVLNAAAALIVGGAVATFEEGVAMSQELLQSGKAYDSFSAFREFSIKAG